MSATSPIQKVRSALVDVKASGQQAVDIKALLAFLDSLDGDAPVNAEVQKLNHESNLAQFKADHERNLAHYKATVDSGTEMFRSVVESAKIALSTSILVNGGATVALLAFVGNLVTKSAPGISSLQTSLAWSLISFALGVLLGAVATGGTYLAQYCYHSEWSRAGAVFHIATVLLIIGSYIAFSFGVGNAYHAFIK
ncbi:hypothetical protein [Roseateles toxinivorans]|uniref:hypothetical protein n=1 Tax=Roseateles toxinivorans TaxID=270368 RepID=UPI00105E32DD|nr:hypothetical protein [Roseateles toxinivorans]